MYAVLTMWLHAIAHASGVAPVPIVVQSVDTSWSMVAEYGPIWGSALLVFGGLSAFLVRNAKSHWIAQGRMLAILTGAGSMLAAVLAWHFDDAPLAGVLVTAIMALKLAWSPTVAHVPAPTVAHAAGDVPTIFTPQGGSAAALMLLAIGALTLQSGCGATGKSALTAVNAVIDCGKLDAKSLEAEVIDLAVDVAKTMLKVGMVDWEKLGSDALNSGTILALCAYGEFKSAMTGPPAVAITPSTSVLVANVARIAPDEALEAMRSRFGGGVILTSHGAL